ncbi:isochorismatase family protein [Streptomyces sp. NPDC021212]|uniref:isochorismatase family protein n=1 Tax=Streptomyces sp. NPDC021212 TaxID=3365118 RepID=UPI0037B706D2
MHDTALIVIDMINTYDHEDAELLLPSVRDVLPAVRGLVTRAREAGIEVIYVNDNFGRWRSHHDELHIRHLTVAVPHGAVAHIHGDLADAALRMMERNMSVEICSADEVRLTHGP